MAAVDFVVRFERGTINCFIYQYVMLAPFAKDPKPDLSLVESAVCVSLPGGFWSLLQGGPDMPVLRRIGKGYADVY